MFVLDFETCFAPGTFGAWAQNPSQLTIVGTILKPLNRFGTLMCGLLACADVKHGHEVRLVGIPMPANDVDIAFVPDSSVVGARRGHVRRLAKGLPLGVVPAVESIMNTSDNGNDSACLLHGVLLQTLG